MNHQAVALACAVTRQQYVRGEIEVEEMDSRLSSIMGLLGDTEQARVLDGAEYIDITLMGSYEPRHEAIRWSWPSYVERRAP